MGRSRSKEARHRTRAAMLAERRELRRLLAGLSPEQWTQPSLCAGWTVRDVVAHMVAWDDRLLYRSRRGHGQALLRFTVLYATSFASMNRVNRRLQRRTQDLAPTDLVRRFGADDGTDLRWLFDGTNPGAHLAEYAIHDRDIRWPLGLTSHTPPDRLAAALDGVLQLPGVRLHARSVLRHTLLEATDVDWARGHGPLQRLPAEEILMSLAGRTRQRRSRSTFS